MKFLKFFFLFFFILSCSNNITFIDNGDDITIEFLEGLNEDPNFKLSKDVNGFYRLKLDRNRNQTIQRITGRLIRNDGRPIETLSGGLRQKVEFSSNLYWWLLKGDTVANITNTFINPLTGELVYTNLPPLINWRDVLVPTINQSSYTDDNTGVFNTVIAPIRNMEGDTMKITAEYVHSITAQEEDSNFFSTIGQKIIKDSVYVILE
ncbi:hypothetical protein [Polaribacter sp.]|uniref:hypothetical protein n=1 Tax=Polaribacter sp. TaxID=1920175 RepID=UPI003F69A9B4